MSLVLMGDNSAKLAMEIKISKKAEIEKANILWYAFLEGNEQAYADLYLLVVDQLFGYASKFTSNHDVIKDSIQDVFINIYTKRNKLRKVEKIRLYLMISIKNKLFNLFKKDKIFYQIDTIEPVFHIDLEEEMDMTDILAEQKLKIAKLLENITPRQRELIYYKFVEELDNNEICELMQMNYQSVRNLLHRTLTKIRKSV